MKLLCSGTRERNERVPLPSARRECAWGHVVSIARSLDNGARLDIAKRFAARAKVWSNIDEFFRASRVIAALHRPCWGNMAYRKNTNDQTETDKEKLLNQINIDIIKLFI